MVVEGGREQRSRSQGRYSQDSKNPDPIKSTSRFGYAGITIAVFAQLVALVFRMYRLCWVSYARVHHMLSFIRNVQGSTMLMLNVNELINCSYPRYLHMQTSNSCSGSDRSNMSDDSAQMNKTSSFSDSHSVQVQVQVQVDSLRLTSQSE